MGSKKLILRLVAAISVILSVFASPALAATSARPEYLVSVVPGSAITLISRESKVPIAVKNEYDYDVRVRVLLRPTTPQVLVLDVVEVVVPAQTTVNAQVPVRAIANGEVELLAWLTTFSGRRIGKTQHLTMMVNADIEANVLIGFTAVVSVLLGLGVWRMTHRRRNPKVVA